MATICSQGVSTPTLLNDPCEGERVLASCVITSNLYIALGLSQDATQEQFNQAVYLALQNLQTQLNNLP